MSAPLTGPLTEDELTAEVIARLGTTPDPRLREVVQAACGICTPSRARSG